MTFVAAAGEQGVMSFDTVIRGIFLKHFRAQRKQTSTKHGCVTAGT